MPEETAPQVQETVEQDIITQETEETVAIKPKAEPKKKEEVKKPEKTEAEKAEEARKLAAAKAERERKEAEEAARKRVAGAFGKGAQMGSKGSRKQKIQSSTIKTNGTMNKEIFVAFATQKGGIGKSTVTALAASYLHNVKGYEGRV